MNKYKLILVFLVHSYCFYSQNKTVNFLNNLDFYELKNQFRSMDSIQKKTVISEYLSKAKKNNDTIQIANGYCLLSEVNLHNKKGIHYADSIIQLTQQIKHIHYPAEGYIQKGRALFHSSNFTITLEYLLKALPIAKKNDNAAQIIRIRHVIAKLKTIGNYHDEALEITKENLKQLDVTSLKEKQPHLYLQLLYTLINSYFNTEQIENTEKHIQEGLALSKQNSNYYYPNFLNCQGILHYLSSDYSNAISYLQRSIALDKNNCELLANNYFYLYQCYQQLYLTDKGITYLLKIDALYQKHPSLVLFAKKSNTLLSNYYKRTAKLDLQISTLDKILGIDSILNRQQKLNFTINKKYEIPKKIAQKDKTITSLKKKSTTTNVYIMILIFLSILLVVGFFYTHIKNKKYKIQYEKLVASAEEKSDSKTQSQQPVGTIDLPEELVNEILKKLQNFEVQKKFVKSYTLHTLAKQLGTNSSYLSKIINHTQQTNFANYLNRLRVNFAIEKLKSDTIYQKYTITAMANEVGFKTAQSFNTAFYKQTGIYPSYFIKQLNKQVQHNSEVS